MDSENLRDIRLAARIRRVDPSAYAEHEHVHRGAGSMQFATLLDGRAFAGNLLFVHRGVLPPGAGIGHHVHHQGEETYVIFDNEAEFTVDGRTSRLTGPVAVPQRRGHSHAIYNSSDRPTQFMNINISLQRGVFDSFDLDDDRTDVTLDATPAFMCVRLDPRLVADTGAVRVRRAIGPGVFSGPWNHLDYITVAAGSAFVDAAHPALEEFAYVLEGSGEAHVAGETAAITAGDAIPVLRDEPHSFASSGSRNLELMVVGFRVG